MKVGKKLEDLAAEVLRQKDYKRDFIAPTSAMALDERTRLHLGDDLEFAVNDLAHQQIGEYLDIGSKYYNRMRTTNPALLAANVNSWFQKDSEPRLLRTLDGTSRAFLSNAYRPLDNYDLAEAVLPVLGDLDLQIVSADITETRLYIKAVSKTIERDVPKGQAIGDGGHTFFDTVAPAVFIGNSEVGKGSLFIEKGTLTKMCTNLAMIPAKGMRKYHVGGKTLLEDEEVYRLLSDQTKELADKALFAKVTDVLKSAFNEDHFEELVGVIKAGTEREIEPTDVNKVIEVVGNRYAMSATTKASVLGHLVKGGSLTQYALANAVTRAAEDEASYDLASEYERAGGAIMMLSGGEWKALNAESPKAKQPLALAA